MSDNDLWEDIQHNMERELGLQKVEFVPMRGLKIGELVAPGCFGIVRNAVLIIPYMSEWADLVEVT